MSHNNSTTVTTSLGGYSAGVTSLTTAVTGTAYSQQPLISINTHGMIHGMATASTSIVTIDSGDLVKYAYTANGKSLPSTPNFKKHKDIFVSEYSLENNSNIHFHFLIWEYLFGEEIDDYGTVFIPDKGLYVAFCSPATRDYFEHWMSNYAFVFFNGDNLQDKTLPLPRQGNLSGIFVPDPEKPKFGFDANFVCGVKNSEFKDWAWIVGNCQHPVYRVGAGWLFQKESEAIIFKMR